MTKPVELVLSRLSNVKQSGSGWLANCPAHNDRNPSLSINEGEDGRALLYCHAGCTTEAILKSMGLNMPDLMPISEHLDIDFHSREPSRTHKSVTVYATDRKALAYLKSHYGSWTAIWPYYNDKKQLVGFVVRWDRQDGKKDIRPISFNGQGWLIGAIPEPRPLYCQNELGATKQIYICEGEKATDAARSLGLTAVTSSGGSKAAAKSDWSPLAGRECIILPDNDKPGEDFANAVATILTRLDKPATVKTIKLPGLEQGGDIFDWIETHNAVEPENLRQQIDAMVNAAPVWRPEPLGLGKTVQRFEPFPINALPEPVKGFVMAGSKALGCDMTFIVLPLLSALAAAVGTTRRIQLKSSWCEPAVVWTAVVSESGTLKSPSQSLALSIVNRLQANKLQQLPKLVEQFQQDKTLWESDMLHWKQKGRSKGEPIPEKPEEPTIERYMVSDITIEALVERLKDSPRGLLCGVDELAAWFGALDAYRGGKGGDAAKWLSIHHADSVIVDRKTGPVKTVYVPFAAVSLCGGIQPETLKRVLGTEHVENGLLARLLLARPPRTPKRWTEATIHKDIIKNMERLFGRLLALDFGLNDDEQLAPIDIPLSPEGKRTWIDFYNTHAKMQSEEEGALAAAFSKLEGYAARLALVVHLVRCAADDPMVNHEAVDAVSVESGAIMAKWFCHEAERVYAVFNESNTDRQFRRLVEWIESRGGSVSVRETQQGRRQYKTAKDAESALGKLVKAGLGRWEPIQQKAKGGRTSTRFTLYTASTVYTTPLKAEENKGCVDVDSAKYPKTEKSAHGDWGEV